MSVAVVIPWSKADEHRARAKAYVVAHYLTEHPDWELTLGELPPCEEWSKGAAVDRAVQATTADRLVIADADSIVAPDALRYAVGLLDEVPWVVPHRRVYRLTPEFTEKVYEGARPRRGRCVRQPYTGPAGGGIVVLTREAYETVGGIDPRFKGWGGEDVSFGMALRALVGEEHRLDADLFHLWHPHPAPDHRGPPESEALVEKYMAARMSPRRMRAVIAGKEPGPAEPLKRPVTFRSQAPRKVVRLGDFKARFDNHLFTTADADLVEMLRRTRYVEEVK